MTVKAGSGAVTPLSCMLLRSRYRRSRFVCIWGRRVCACDEVYLGYKANLILLRSLSAWTLVARRRNSHRCLVNAIMSYLSYVGM